MSCKVSKAMTWEVGGLLCLVFTNNCEAVLLFSGICYVQGWGGGGFTFSECYGMIYYLFKSRHNQSTN